MRLKIKIKIPENEFWTEKYRGKEIENLEVTCIQFPDGVSWTTYGESFNVEIIKDDPPSPSVQNSGGLPAIFGQKLKEMSVIFQEEK